jgi:hypothetical protein
VKWKTTVVAVLVAVIGSVGAVAGSHAPARPWIWYFRTPTPQSCAAQLQVMKYGAVCPSD